MGKTRQSADLVSDNNIFIDVSNDRVGIGSTIPQYKLDVNGTVKATSFSGDGANLTSISASYAASSGISTVSQGLTGTPNIVVGIATANTEFDVGVGGTIFTSLPTGRTGIGTNNPRFTLEVGAVGAGGTQLWVNGNARITGILTIGTSSIVFDGTSNTINVGSGTTISSTGITGSGAGLTALNASNITTGIVSTARFDSNSNAFGLRTISTNDPTGGNDGDIWYKV
jgi:hypothetical protein